MVRSAGVESPRTGAGRTPAGLRRPPPGRTGDDGREAFFLVTGRVEVRRNADLVASTDVELIVFDGASFRSALHLSPSLATQVEDARHARSQVA